MSLTEPAGMTVGELRLWLATMPDNAVVVVDDESANAARRPAAINGPWRLEENDDSSVDFWQDNEESEALYLETEAAAERPFASLPFGILIHPR